MSTVRPVGPRAAATGYDSCLRRCEPCGIAASNALDAGRVKYIHAELLSNIPEKSRSGAAEALAAALNVRNRVSKQNRFGFFTSEDAVTWVVFTHLLRTKQLVTALQHAGVFGDDVSEQPALLLWGVPIDPDPRGHDIRARLIRECTDLGEKPESYSEPDVIVDLGRAGLVFIEVKYLSGNDDKPEGYAGWPKYESRGRIDWDFTAVRGSGHYELARNWCLLNRLADGRPGALANLGPSKLFVGGEGDRLDRFAAALAARGSLRFIKVTWPHLLQSVLPSAPEWFTNFCKQRRLIDNAAAPPTLRHLVRQ